VIRQPSAATGDQYLRMRVAEAVSGSTGAAGVAVRTSVGLSRSDPRP
jgi:hypothetical protein